MGWWKSKVAFQMFSCFCVFRNIAFIPSWIMVPLALLLLFSSYKLVGFVFFSLLFTSLALLLSTVLFMWKHKAVTFDEGNGFSFEEETPQLGRESVIAVAPTPMHTVTDAKECEEEQVSDDECQEEVLFLSTSEDYEVDHTPDKCSDGTISDEDSLIEIALPSGHFVSHNHIQNTEESDSKYNNCCSLQQKKRELSSAPEALFNQQSLLEFLAEFNEMNEEDNLIEIDIAMGSIKCSRFEIEA